jgi:NADP-dependent 3-hydroxy acid dehydrogenase YdfG
VSPAVGPGIAFVTGAAGSKGGAVVAQLEGDGYRVAGVDLRPSLGALSLIADVTNRSALVAAVAEATERLGSISVLVAAAGLRDPAPFGTLDRARWLQLLAVHLGGTGNACAAVLPGMLEAGRGTIVTLSSAAAVVGASGDAYRAAATGTVLAFTRSLATEVASRGIRVNCVAGGSPGAVAGAVSHLVQDGDFYVGQVFMPAGEEVT